MTPRETQMLAALKRALFYFESPLCPPMFNATGAVDDVRAAIAATENKEIKR